MAAKNLPKVFFDVAVNGKPSGRMTFKVRVCHIFKEAVYSFYFFCPILTLQYNHLAYY